MHSKIFQPVLAGTPASLQKPLKASLVPFASSPFGFSVKSAPYRFIRSSFSSLMSMPITTSAPMPLATCTMKLPTPPAAPTTTTRSPLVRRARTAAWYGVVTASAITARCSSGVPLRASTTHRNSAGATMWLE